MQGIRPPTGQHELDHTNHTDHTDQESTCPQKDLNHEVAINDLFVRGCGALAYRSRLPLVAL